MYKLLIFIIVIFALNSVHAQVGIGTLDPKETLHVNGNVIVDGIDSAGTLAIVGADDQGTLTSLNLGSNLSIRNNALELVRSTTYGIGDIDISGVTIIAQHVHNLDLKIGPGEINEGKTVIKIFGTPANFKLTGIQDGVDGLHLFFYHLGSKNIQLLNQDNINSLLSMPENRINVLASSETISGQGSVEFIYDGTSQRWLLLSIHD